MFESSSLFLADAQLEQVAALQRTMNASFAQLCQLLTELHHDAPEPDAEFLADQVALLLQVCPVTAQNLLGLALTVTGLPALLEALQRDLLTERHVRAIIGELGKTPLTQLQQAAVVAVVLAKLHGQTPGELVRLVQRTVLLIDLGAAERRRQARIRERRVSFHPGTDGEATLIATGPLAQIAAVKASLEATTAHPQPRDERSHDERMFDMFIDLLTGGHDRPEHWTAAVVVPYSTSQGGELELAEVPGFGPILPSTARDLLHHTRGVQRVAVDNRDGHVITVDEHTHIPQPDEVPGRTPTAMGDNRFASSAAAQAAQQPIDLTNRTPPPTASPAGCDGSSRPATAPACSPAAPGTPAAATWTTANPGPPEPPTTTTCKRSAGTTTVPNTPPSTSSSSPTAPTDGSTTTADLGTTDHPRATEPAPPTPSTPLPPRCKAACCRGCAASAAPAQGVPHLHPNLPPSTSSSAHARTAALGRAGRTTPARTS